MTIAIIKEIENLLAELKNGFSTELTAIEQEAIALEQKFMPGFKALMHKIASTIGAQGLTILEQGLSDIVTVIESGGNVGVAIGALIPQVTAQVAADLKQDAATAAHGAVELLISTLPVPASGTAASDAAAGAGADTAGAAAV